MKMIISNSSSVPIYEQIKSSIIEQIMNGELEENEILPSIRALAADIRISVMTIKKAYDELERDGFIETVQGKGSFVVPRTQELVQEQARKEIEENIQNIVNMAKKYNISKKEICETMDVYMEECYEKRD